jgi:hypothetical protein
MGENTCLYLQNHVEIVIVAAQSIPPEELVRDVF